jgi:hypothetical protein
MAASRVRTTYLLLFVYLTASRHSQPAGRINWYDIDNRRL